MGQQSREEIHSEIGFEKVYKIHFKPLYAYARTIVGDTDTAIEIVQQVFFKLWEKRNALEIKETVRGYLYRAVFNESMNHMKHLKVRETYVQNVKNEAAYESSALQNMEAAETEKRIRKALNDLPERCRTVFHLCRFEDLKYKEVSEKLNLPVKTVENEMGKALRLLRLSLSDLISVIFLTFHLL